MKNEKLSTIYFNICYSEFNRPNYLGCESIRPLQKGRFIDITKTKEKNICVVKHIIIFLLSPLGGLEGFIEEAPLTSQGGLFNILDPRSSLAFNSIR